MGDNWVHLCIDMQRVFAENTPWHVPWMRNVSPQIEEISRLYAQRTVFTRFITPQRPEQVPGMWRAYYEKWQEMTREQLDAGLLEIVPSLRQFIPPARVFDKLTYSPWIGGDLHQIFSAEGVDTLVVTGGETDICVLAAAIGAIDLGYRVIVLRDAVCSGANETHDATLEVLGDRFSVQLSMLTTEEFLGSL